MTDENTIIRHHLLEIILWPNDDGTFRTILNSADRLKELGIYNDHRLTITMTQSEHSTLHGTNRSEATRKKLSASMKSAMIGERNPMYGQTRSEETRKKISKSLKGRTPSNKGKTMSAEQKQKIREAQKASWARRKAQRINTE